MRSQASAASLGVEKAQPSTPKPAFRFHLLFQVLYYYVDLGFLVFQIIQYWFLGL